MVRTAAFAAALSLLVAVAPAGALPRGQQHPTHSFLADKVKAAPALQPSEVYDKDYPVDMAKLTPEELRYKAQADYAKAIAVLKKEAAEAEAALREMEKALKDYQDAAAAAKKAKLEAEDALRNKDKYTADSVDAETKAKLEAAEAATHKDAVSKEQAELAAAEKAYQDALAGKQGTQAKLDAMKKKHDELCAQIKALEAESAAMGHTMSDHNRELSAKKALADAENGQISGAQRRAQEEAAQAEAAKRDAEAAKARLAQAEHLATGAEADQGKLQDAIAKEQGEYDAAAEKFRKEDTDVEAAQQRVDRAKAELAKYEQQPMKFSGAASAGFTAVLLAPLFLQ